MLRVDNVESLSIFVSHGCVAVEMPSERTRFEWRSQRLEEVVGPRQLNDDDGGEDGHLVLSSSSQTDGLTRRQGASRPRCTVTD